MQPEASKEGLATVQSNGENKSCFLLEHEEGCGHRARILPGMNQILMGQGNTEVLLQGFVSPTGCIAITVVVPY